MNRTNRRIRRVVVSVLVLAVLFCNEIVLTAFFIHDGQLETCLRWSLRCLNALLLGLAVFNIVFNRTTVVLRVDLAFLSIGVALLLVESYLRIVKVSQDVLEVDTLRLRVPDQWLHHRLESNTVAYVDWGGRKPVVYKTNSLGHRDLEVRRVPKISEHAARILILGDSFAECIGVSYKDGFVEKLRRALQNMKVDIEFLNNGTTSYCPRLEKRSLERFLAQGYRPDGVLLFLDLSDIHDEVDSGWYGDWQEYSLEDLKFVEAKRELRLAKSRVSKREASPYDGVFRLRVIQVWRDFLETLSATMHAGQLSSFEALWEYERYSWTEQDYWTNGLDWVSTGLDRCRQEIASIRNLCDQQEMSFAIVIYPYPVQLMSSHYPSLHQIAFQEFCEQEGILLIDLTDHFKNADRWEDYFIPGDVHWNKRGHRLVAAALVARYADWLPAAAKVNTSVMPLK